ncbi:MAG: hypothetical protein WA738_03380 [Candidatus Angelobacter sp.]
MKRLRRITEAEVIVSFLQGEFFHPEYDTDREQFASIVNHPDLTNDAENAIRRALLFRRRDTMWWELPEDRQWWEVEFEPGDVERVRVFPRAHWRKLAQGNFKAVHVAERVRKQLTASQADSFVRKLAAISAGKRPEATKGLVIFLGIDEHQPVTLLEGNHRFIASLLAPEANILADARMIGAFSSNMEKCCWYKTNAKTLFRCLKNRIQHYWDRDPDVVQLLEQTTEGRTVSKSAERPGPVKSTIVSH